MDTWFDPIEAGLRERVGGFIEAIPETELDAAAAMKAPASPAVVTAAGRAGSRTHST